MTSKRKEKFFHILVVDDDNRLRRLLEQFLKENKFIVNSASSALQAKKYLHLLKFDLLVLDVMMPGEDGLHFAEQIRKSSEVPILMLTAMDESKNRIEGLQKGVDDYMGKPFEPQELLLRINAILRRIQKKQNHNFDVISFGNYTYDQSNNLLTKDGTRIDLTLAESDLLRILLLNKNNIVNRYKIMELGSSLSNPRTVDVQIIRLRRKIESEPNKPRYIQTIRGKGYILKTGPQT